MPFKLKKTVQCKKCPWKVSTDPYDIPDGYCELKHKKLENTISDGNIDFQKPLQIMACHHSKENNMQHCIGWLDNQLGPGNNIMLRISMMKCENISKIRTIGEQHKNFKDTLPH